MDALTLWSKLGRSAAGRWLFSRIVSFRAPYFASIGPLVDELEVGRCVARIRHRRRVQNHIGTVHAIALCNLAELVGGVGTDASMPASMRWIPKGMRVSYIAKAVGTMRAVAVIPPIDEEAGARDLEVPVTIEDPRGTRVFEATITMWISPRPKKTP